MGELVGLELTIFIKPMYIFIFINIEELGGQKYSVLYKIH